MPHWLKKIRRLGYIKFWPNTMQCHDLLVLVTETLPAPVVTIRSELWTSRPECSESEMTTDLWKNVLSIPKIKRIHQTAWRTMGDSAFVTGFWDIGMNWKVVFWVAGGGDFLKWSTAAAISRYITYFGKTFCRTHVERIHRIHPISTSTRHSPAAIGPLTRRCKCRRFAASNMEDAQENLRTWTGAANATHQGGEKNEWHGKAIVFNLGAWAVVSAVSVRGIGFCKVTLMWMKAVWEWNPPCQAYFPFAKIRNWQSDIPSGNETPSMDFPIAVMTGGYPLNGQNKICSNVACTKETSMTWGWDIKHERRIPSPQY